MLHVSATDASHGQKLHHVVALASCEELSLGGTHLHAQADSQEWLLAGAAVLSSQNLAFHTALSEPSGDDYSM